MSMFYRKEEYGFTLVEVMVSHGPENLRTIMCQAYEDTLKSTETTIGLDFLNMPGIGRDERHVNAHTRKRG